VTSKRAGSSRGLSKSKLIAYRQCARRIWLEVHRRDLNRTSPATQAIFDTGHRVGEVAQRIYGRGGGHLVPFEPGLGAAVEETRGVLRAGGSEPVFEATFEHMGVLVRVDILQRDGGDYRVVEVKAATGVKGVHIEDCAVQAWVIEQGGLSLESVSLALINSRFVYAGDGDYSGLLTEWDVTEQVRERLPEVSAWVEEARDVLGKPEPSVRVGLHCSHPYSCAFYDHCKPELGQYPVTGLGGKKRELFEWMHEGFTDIREVPRDRLSPKQQRISTVTAAEAYDLEPGASEFERELDYPRHYLDFETASFAVPIWEGTRPYEQLPFQWSCHVEEAGRPVRHAEFLDLSGDPPMRKFTESLVATLGSKGPVLVYSGFEARVIRGLAERYPDLRDPLEAVRDRLVDLLPVTRDHYYHPDMLGSWSLKAVAPTVAQDLRFDELEDVQDGTGAQVAYAEAIDPATSAERRDAIRRALLDYCKLDTLSLVRLVEFFRNPG